MPYALVVIGLLLIVTGAKDTYKQFGQQLSQDFTGQNNFTYWIVALGAVGAAGYNKTLEPLSRIFMLIIIVSFVIAKGNPDKSANGGIFNQFMDAIKNGPDHSKIASNVSGNGTGVNVADHTASDISAVTNVADASINADVQKHSANIAGFSKIVSMVLPLVG